MNKERRRLTIQRNTDFSNMVKQRFEKEQGKSTAKNQSKKFKNTETPFKCGKTNKNRPVLVDKNLSSFMCPCFESGCTKDGHQKQENDRQMKKYDQLIKKQYEEKSIKNSPVRPGWKQKMKDYIHDQKEDSFRYDKNKPLIDEIIKRHVKVQVMPKMKFQLEQQLKQERLNKSLRSNKSADKSFSPPSALKSITSHDRLDKRILNLQTLSLNTKSICLDKSSTKFSVQPNLKSNKVQESAKQNYGHVRLSSQRPKTQSCKSLSRNMSL